MALRSAIIDGDPECALYEAGVLLRAGKTDAIEEILIRAVAQAGEIVRPAQSGMWSECVRDLWQIVESDERLSVRAVFVLVARCCLLFRKLEGSGVGRPTLAKLREAVLPDFPAGATLSPAGLERFRAILPPASEEFADERAFAERVLAGLMHICATGSPRLAVEYLSRKKTQITLPSLSGWPAPDGSRDTDIVWFVWGAMLIYYGALEGSAGQLVNAAWNLFKTRYKRGSKGERLGLLWAVCLPQMPPLWTPDDMRILQRVHDTASDLWKRLPAAAQAPATKTPRESKNAQTDYFDTRIRGIDVSAKAPRAAKAEMQSVDKPAPEPVEAGHGVRDRPRFDWENYGIKTKK